MAHCLGGLMDLPHGECNSILLRHVMDFNFAHVPEKFLVIGEAMGAGIVSETAIGQRPAGSGKTPVNAG